MRSSFALSARVHQFASMTLTARQVSVGITIWRPRSANARVTRSCRQAGKVSSAQKPDLGPQRCGRTTKQPRRRGRTSAPAACELALPTHCGHTPHRIRSREPVARTLLGRRACTSNVGLDSVTLNKPCAWPPIRPSSLNRCRTMRLHITSMLPGGAASARHWQFRRLRCLRRRLRSEVSVRADRVTNTHRAAVLRQHGAKTISTRDRDFRKSEGLTVLEPLG